MTRIIALASIIILAYFLLWLTKVADNWRAPGVNAHPRQSIHTCIHDGATYSMQISSMDQLFEVNYVKRAGMDCINPYFPAIHIMLKAEHNAWLHIVYTDHKNQDWQQFVDAIDPKIYSFYTLEQDFYDAPQWGYTLFRKEISFWKGHAYAVIVDHQHKTIKCIGGIEWGYKLPYFSIRPESIVPSALTLWDWQKDWLILKIKFNGYQDIE